MSGQGEAAAGNRAAEHNTFPKLLLRNAKTFGARPAMRHKDYGIWQSWTWAEQKSEIEALALGLKALGLRYRDAALRGGNIGFSNLHQLLQDLAEGRSKALPCGAGVGMLAVDHEGGLNLCHRFTGSDLPTFGSVSRGIDREPLAEFIAQRAERAGKGCETCRIRNLCAGGCYHESYAHFGDPQSPTYHYCDLMRDWVDFGIGLYAELTAEAPQFFDTHIAPRRAWGK